jgi:hypoxanthine phosphoribosyltransferase
MRKLIDSADIADRVEALARSIAAELPTDMVMVVVMKGAMVFAADLMRALWREGARPRMDTIQLSSYGDGTVSTGEITLVGPLPSRIRGRSVLLVDDIADSGRSLNWARGQLLQAGAADVRICALLDKPARRTKPFPLDFIGFTIDDLFVVGYGIDHAEDHRYLPFIGVED